MAEEQNELRQVNWSEIFSFTQIFKSFKMAIHPSKLILAIAAIILILALGKGMDTVWGWVGGNAMNNEIKDYCGKPASKFKEARKLWCEDGQLGDALKLRGTMENLKLGKASFPPVTAAAPSVGSGWTKKEDWQADLLHAEFEKIAGAEKTDAKPSNQTLEDVKKAKIGYSSLLSQAKDDFNTSQARIIKYLDDAKTEAEKNLEKTVIADNRDKAREKIAKDYQAAQRGLLVNEVEFDKAVQAVKGDGVFALMVEWQKDCLHGAVKAVWAGNIRGGLNATINELAGKNRIGALTSDVPSENNVEQPETAPGLLFFVIMSVQSFGWLFSQHTLFGIIFVLVAMAIIAVFGGAIHRIAAMHFAREEKISIAQAIKFSLSRFLSFYTAPLIPLVIIGVLSAILYLAGLCFNVWILDIVVSVLAFLAIIVGMFIAFMSIGLVAGAPLMYPTIAMEGSDCFDAISRSFSYVFAKPWRAIFYGLVATVYGVITYLFVRAFAFIALATTHCLVKSGVLADGEMLGEGAKKLDVVWTAPTFWSLLPSFSWPAMSFLEKICAVFIWAWVFLVAASVLAFLLSFAASATTVIYSLLRRHVDATDLDDVYVEEAAEPAAAPAAPVADATPTATNAGEEKKS